MSIETDIANLQNSVQELESLASTLQPQANELLLRTEAFETLTMQIENLESRVLALENQ